MFILKALEVQRGRDGVSLLLCQLLSRPGCHDKNNYLSAAQALLSVEMMALSIFISVTLWLL